MGVNTWEGVEWLDQDRFVGLLRWAIRLDAIDLNAAPETALLERLTAKAEAAGYRVDRLLPPSATRPAATRKRSAATRGGGTPSRFRPPTRPPGAP